MNFIKEPYLQLPTADGITVMWETDERASSLLLVWNAACPDCGDVAYSPVGEARTYSGAEGLVHAVMADGLSPATDYCYITVSENMEGQVRSRQGVFRTAPLTGAPLSFAVTSESGGSGSPARVIDAVVESIAAERPDFLLFVGDMVSDGNRPRDWDEYLFTTFRRLISHTPFYHCAGNHEEHAGQMARLLATPDCGYYSFSYGCADFIALDSTAISDHVKDENGQYTIELTESLTEENPQVMFLIDSLERSTASWKFVYLHYPPYFAGTWEAPALRPLCDIFDRYGVDLVFTSHAIVYERSHPIRGGALDEVNGIRYLVVGGAGACPEWFHHKKAWHTARSRAVPHFVHVAVTPKHLELMALDLEGRLFDTLTLTK